MILLSTTATTVMDIGNFIGTVGFPIAMCCAMFWYVKYTTDANRKETEQMRKEHAEEMSKVTTALNNNTLAVEKLCVMLGGENNVKKVVE